MVSSFSQNKNLELQATGDHNGTWGITLNQVISYIDQMAGAGVTINTTGGTTNITSTQLQYLRWNITGALVSNATLNIQQNSAGQNVSGLFLVDNQTTGNFTVTVQNQSGANRTTTIPQGRKVIVYTDGTHVDVAATPDLIYAGSLAGGTTAYTCTLPGTNTTAYTSGLTVQALVNATSTGAATLNAASLGAKSIYKPSATGPTAVVAGDLVINQLYTFVYDTALNAGAGGWHLTSGQPITTTFSDATFRVQDDGDATKQFALQLSSITTGTTRTWTVPDVSSTFTGTDATQTLTNKSLTSPTITGSPTAAGSTWTNLGTVTTADINGGTVDGTVIGGASAAAGTFTTGTVTSLVLNGTTYTNNLLTQGIETIWIPAPAMTTRTTQGATASTVESSTNKIMQKAYDFPDGTVSGDIDYVQFTVRMPKSWNLGTVTASFVWTANSTSTNSVFWEIRAVALSDTNAIDTAFGTAANVTDANQSTAYSLNISGETGALTIGNSPAAQDWVVFQVNRDPTNVADNFAATAQLLGVTIRYTINAANDT